VARSPETQGTIAASGCGAVKSIAEAVEWILARPFQERQRTTIESRFEPSTSAPKRLRLKLRAQEAQQAQRIASKHDPPKLPCNQPSTHCIQRHSASVRLLRQAPSASGNMRVRDDLRRSSRRLEVARDMRTISFTMRSCIWHAVSLLGMDSSPDPITRPRASLMATSTAAPLRTPFQWRRRGRHPHSCRFGGDLLGAASRHVTDRFALP